MRGGQSAGVQSRSEKGDMGSGGLGKWRITSTETVLGWPGKMKSLLGQECMEVFAVVRESKYEMAE